MTLTITTTKEAEEQIKVMRMNHRENITKGMNTNRVRKKTNNKNNNKTKGKKENKKSKGSK